MPLKDFLFTSESVSEGHPDKMCDQISDAVLDALLAEDPNSRVALESLAKTGLIVLAGEITSKARPDYVKIARQTALEIGYNSSEVGFDGNMCAVLTAIEPQSADISQGVTEGEGLFKDQGAGDQGLMFGYACDETPELMPAPIQYSHNILRVLAEARHSGAEKLLLPDAKSQVTLRYVDGRPTASTAVVLSTQHAATDGNGREIESGDVQAIVLPYIKKVMHDVGMPDKAHLYVNPTGRFVIGGPDGDTGLTGRKIIVDTYGGAAPHGGGAFSGKDPTKVDRSAAYAARYVAKNIVAAGLADRCTLQLAYAIGVARPLSIYIDTHGTGKVSEDQLEKAAAKAMDLTPRGIRTHLDLNRPIYARTSAYGHFGRTPDNEGGFSWEKTDLVEALKRAV